MTIDRRLRLAVVANLAIVVLQATFGFAAGSLGLLADAGHNLVDVFGVVLALVAVRMARRPPDERRSFGYHRSPVLAAQANAALILVMAALLGSEAVRRLFDPRPVDTGIVIVVAFAGAVVNALAALALRGHGGDLNLRGAMLHLAGDAAVSMGVVLAAVVMGAVGGAYWLDPAVSLAVSGFLGWQAVRLLRETADVLLESAPVGLSDGALTIAINDLPGVDEVHDLHVWTLGHGLHALSAHVVLTDHPNLEEAQATVNTVRRHLNDDFGITHITLEAECETCLEPGVDDPCAMTFTVSHAAPRAHGHAGHGHAH